MKKMRLLVTTCCLLACAGTAAAWSHPLGDVIVGAKGSKFLDKALDAFPLHLEGQSQYDTNYTLTEGCYQGLLGYYAGVENQMDWAGQSELQSKARPGFTAGHGLTICAGM